MIKNKLNRDSISLGRRKLSLPGLIKLYEGNYIKLINLIPKIKENSFFNFCLPEGKEHSEVSLKISLISKYTSTLVIKQSNFSINKIVDTKVEVAIYHDFKMAEVIRFNGKKQFWIRNTYPNKNMFAKDEKYQWNKFFSEWLSFSKKEGLSEKININNALY